RGTRDRHLQEVVDLTPRRRDGRGAAAAPGTGGVGPADGVRVVHPTRAEGLDVAAAAAGHVGGQALHPGARCRVVALVEVGVTGEPEVDTLRCEQAFEARVALKGGVTRLARLIRVER